jgi:hypothetical protein
MIILLSSIPAVIKGFWAYVRNDGGTVTAQGQLPLILKTSPELYDTTLLCGCDSGKDGKLYFISFIDLLYNFYAFVTADGGTSVSASHAQGVLNGLGQNLNNASLVCTCESGKEDKLYYLIP